MKLVARIALQMNSFRQQYKELGMFVSQGFIKVLLKRDTLNRILCITLVQKNNSVVEIRNKMVDLAERIEVGRLEFTNNGCPKSEEVEILVAEECFENSRIYLLVTKWNGNELVSGLKIVTRDDEEHYIVAGAAPYTLVFISNQYEEIHKPEYDLTEYEVVLLTD